MRLQQPLRLAFIVAMGLACASRSDDAVRDHITSALSDTLGATAEPSVGFLNNRSHLQVSLSSARFPQASDSTFAVDARQIARFTLAHYESAPALDSITILDREAVAKGMWKIRHAQRFSVDELRQSDP